MVSIAGEPLSGLKRRTLVYIFDNLRRVVRDWAEAGVCGTETLESPGTRANRPRCTRSGKIRAVRANASALITNHTGLDSQGRSTVDVLSHAAGFQLIALFSPEHGLAGRNDEKVSSTKDPSTGLPVYSLYGETRRPTEEMLKGIDALVFDVQDAGVRFYTYTATMGYCMEKPRNAKSPSSSSTGRTCLAERLSKARCSMRTRLIFVAYFPLPVRYALTIGELAQFFNTENHIAPTCTSYHEELASQLFLRKHRHQVDSALAESAHNQGIHRLSRD